MKRKLSRKTKKAIRGSITILLVIILLPMMTFSAVIVDISRINMAKSMVSSAGDLTMNAALANYDTILKDVYGLFAMSQQTAEAEGEEAAETQLARDLRDYFAETIAAYGVVGKKEAGNYVDNLIGDFKDIINDANTETDNFLEMDVSSEKFTFESTPVVESSLANPAILRKQIVEYTKYRAPLSFGLSFIDALKSFKSVEEQNKVVEAQVAAQESTQDVTKNCRKLIQLIREFDKLILAIDNGEKTVTGSANSTDGVKIPIWITETGDSPYSLQLDKYRQTWGNNNNYSHINKINLIFLANPPTMNNLYLYQLSSGSAVVEYIKQDGKGLEANSGISVSPTLADTTEAAKQQVYDHISALSSQDVLETTYQNQDFLDTSYLNWDYTDYKNEEGAINTFTQYEKFLLDQNETVKYSSVKAALEQIAILEKYYSNYSNKIGEEISAAEGELTTAKTNTTNAQKAMNTPKNSIQQILTSVYETSSTFYTAIAEEEEPLSCLDATTVKDKVLTLLQAEEVKLPGGQQYGTNLVEYYTIRNFNGFYNKFKENANDADDIYLKYFKSIVTSLKESEDIAESANKYITSGSTQTFEAYMKDAEGKKVVDKDLYKILNCLITCSKAVQQIPGLIDTYNAATPGYQDLVNVQHEKQQTLNTLNAQKANVTADYHLELNGHRAFTTAYQKDIFYYAKYIATAKSIVGREAAAVSKQYIALRDNVKALRDQLVAIEKQVGLTEGAIKTYDKNVDAWEGANNGYIGANESDSFSDQSAADIENARSQYDLDSFNTLSQYVTSMKVYFENFYNYIVDDTHFKYGNAKIDTITTADHAINAVSGIKSSLSSVVTVEEAAQKFATLYSADTTPKLEVSAQRTYLGDPSLPEYILQIQILKYLDSAYPAQETQTESQKSEENSYTSSVKDLAGEGANEDGSDSTGEAIESADADNGGKYGYTYKKATIDGTLPSKGIDPTQITSKQFDMDVSDTEDGGLDVDTSTGMDAQKNTLSKVLTNIGNAVTAGIENLYILTYLFENFSYNTMVQDEVADNYKFDMKATPMAQYTNLKKHLGTAKNWQDYEGKIKTMSNYPITAKNNLIYGAELEYILYGNTTAKSNVTYAKASIYAIRFGFNCIYAFTNSEIRNTTMSAGLAVQAATLGIVPYQLVQIILQLALAAAESAIDLDMMNCGLDVAIVKTTDSWSLSISGLSETAANLATSVVNTATDKIITGAVNIVSQGIQGIVDATTDQLSGAITDVTTNLTTATQKVVQDAIDQAFSHVMGKVEEGINSLQYLEMNDKESIKTEVTNIFAGIKGTLRTEITSMFAGNDLALKAMDTIVAYAEYTVTQVQNKVIGVIDAVPAEEDISQAVIAQITSIKQYMIQVATSAVSDTIGAVQSVVESAVAEVESTLQDYANQAKDLTEQEAEKLKEKVQETTNGYINKYLDSGNSTAIGAGTSAAGSSSNSVASMMKFGYKEYLMLFMFLGLCVDSSSDAILKRTADVIQLNVQHAATAGDFKHTMGSQFLMQNAYTYITVNASVKLDMFFVNMDFFSRLLSDDETTVEGQIDTAATITYKGLLGY